MLVFVNAKGKKDATGKDYDDCFSECADRSLAPPGVFRKQYADSQFMRSSNGGEYVKAVDALLASDV